MSWEDVHKEKIERIQMLCEETIDQLNVLSEPGEMAALAIEAINQIQTIVSPD